MQTAEIIQSVLEKPLHLRPAANLDGLPISRTSKWDSSLWDLDNPTHGSGVGNSRISWRINFSDGSSLLDPAHSAMLDWLRRFVWSLFTAPGDNAPFLKPGSAGVVSAGLHRFVPWLVANSIRLPSELDRVALDGYLSDLPGILANTIEDDEMGDEVSVSVHAAYNAISVVYKLWQQRRALSAAGIEPMPERPWPAVKGAEALAKTIATEARGWIQPLPDEVAVPLLNKGAWFLGTPADDVMRLQETLSAAYNREPGTHPRGPGVTRSGRKRRQRAQCERFVFSVLDGDDAPWHGPLEAEIRNDGKAGGMLRVLQLVKAVQAAAMLVLQGLVGLRASELCGIPAGINEETGLPHCVHVRLSSTGLNEEFILRSDLSKTEEAPREVPWQLGMRPIGSTDIPITVRAIQVLDRLVAPYRSLLGTDRLLVSLSTKVGLPKEPSGVARLISEQINMLYRAFIEEWVDLSQIPNESQHRIAQDDLVRWRESNGRVITSHQLRKTFALYVLSVDPRLLPAVKRQFQHISMAMTERGYWGTNSLQIEPVNAVAAQQTAKLMFELATGRTKAAGKMGEQLERGIGSLRDRLASMGIEAGWRETLRWVRTNDLQITFGAHGGCLALNPSRMECWKRSGCRPLGHVTPNYKTREPSVCAGCSCFLMDARHEPFWSQRFVENEMAYREAKLRKATEGFRRVHDRANQARAFLQHIGVDIAPLERIVEEGVEKCR